MFDRFSTLWTKGLIACGQFLWICLQFQKPSNNQTWQVKRPTCSGVSQLRIMLSSSLGHVKNIYNFIFASTLRTTKLGSIIDQHGLTLPRGWWWWHCVKSVEIRSYFWSVFSCIRIEYGPEITPYLDTFHAVWCYYYSMSSLTIRLGRIKLVNTL